MLIHDTIQNSKKKNRGRINKEGTRRSGDCENKIEFWSQIAFEAVIMICVYLDEREFFLRNPDLLFV